LRFNKAAEESISFLPRAAEQFNGREGETASLLKLALLNSELRVIGFAPRQLNRSMLRGKLQL
jgi:hypothetical protein